MEFSRQEYWSGISCPPPGDLPNPGIKPLSPASPAMQADSFLLSHWGSPHPHPHKLCPQVPSLGPSDQIACFQVPERHFSVCCPTQTALSLSFPRWEWQATGCFEKNLSSSSLLFLPPPPQNARTCWLLSITWGSCWRSESALVPCK